LTVGGFSNGLYSGYTTGGGLYFDGFGHNFDDAAGTTGPHAGNPSAVSSLNFTVTDTGGNFANVFDLVSLATPAGGDGPAYFAADVFDRACGAGGGANCTGLVGVSGTPSTGVPEASGSIPVAMSIGIFALIATWKRRGRQTIQ
jgi:hypothetical protein